MFRRRTSPFTNEKIIALDQFNDTLLATTPSRPSHPFEVEERAFNVALSESSGVSSELPLLKSPVESLAQKISRFFTDTFERLKNFFEFEASPHEPWYKTINWREFFEITVPIIFFTLVVIVLYLISKQLWSASKRAEFSWPSLKTPQLLTQEESLLKELRRALKKQDWSNASRLRWRLFLIRTEEVSSRTPLEFEHISHIKDVRNLPSSIDQYLSMFYQKGSTAEWYSGYDRELTKLENEEVT